MLVASAAAAAISLGTQGWPSSGLLATTPAFVAMLVAAGYFLIRFQYRNDIEALDLFEAVLAPAIVIFPGALVVGLVAVAKAITGILHRNEPLKAGFNVAQWTLAAGAGSLTFEALAQDRVLSGRTVLAVAAALIVVAMVNQVAFVSVIGISQGQPIRRVLAGLAPVIVPGWLIAWVVNVAFGILFVLTALWHPWAIFIGAVPLLALHYAYRGYATASADRTRMAGMHRATRALAEPVDPREAIPDFLAAVRDCFQARMVDLLILNEGGRAVYRVSDAANGYVSFQESWNSHTLAMLLLERGHTCRVSQSSADAVTFMLLGLEDCRDCLAAPLIDGEHKIGVLCVYDPGGHEGFEEGEIAVLDALAVEVSHAMLKASLLDTILEEQQKLSDIVGSTSDGIMTISPVGTIKTWNPALERITGQPASNMIGSRLFGSLAPRNADGIAVWLERWVDDEITLPADIEITTRSGETRWLSCSYTRVLDGEGRPSMLIIVARDATEARELERLKDDFVATVSHELRTPLTPIKGWAVTLLQLGDHLQPEQREEGVQAILRHAERLERLITNILEVSKVERGLSDRHEAIVDVLAVAEKTICDFRAGNGSRVIQLRTLGDQHRTRGDEVWIEQILTNLLSNAMKYSPAELPIEVAVSSADGVIEVSVADRGPGIPVNETDRIFERFKRLGDHMTRAQGGTGLGLYIARQLARAIGGELTVQSAPDQGATFTLRLTAQDETIPVAS